MDRTHRGTHTLLVVTLAQDVSNNLIHKSIGSDQKNIKQLGQVSAANPVNAEPLSPSKKELFELVRMEGNDRLV